MARTITIDTNILIGAFKRQDPYHSDVQAFVSQEGSMLGLDTDCVILQEYRNNLRSNQGFEKWVNRLFQKQRIQYCNGNLPLRHRTALATFGCHEPTDQVFVAVAYHSDKILISEDSDVGKGPKGSEPPHCHAGEYLREQMGIRVFSAEEASDWWSSQT